MFLKSQVSKIEVIGEVHAGVESIFLLTISEI